MTQQSRTSRLPVALATMFLVLSTAAFAAAFYLYDGAAVATGLYEVAYDWISSQLATQQPEPAVQEPTNPETELVLAPGMDEEFALRVWQEQVDSQPMIERLISGSVKSMRIRTVDVNRDTAVMDVEVTLADGTTGPGEIVLRKYDGDWYVATATGKRTSGDPKSMSSTMGSAENTGEPTPLPDVEDIDLALLNTVLEQQRLSQKVMEEYADGTVKEVVIQDVTAGPNTVTLDVLMKESHGTATAKIVAIRSKTDAEPTWFLARFTKTGADHPDPK